MYMEECSLQCEIGSNLNVRECFIRVWSIHGVEGPADTGCVYKPCWKNTHKIWWEITGE